jgi:hypothetical protein
LAYLVAAGCGEVSDKSDGGTTDAPVNVIDGSAGADAGGTDAPPECLSEFDCNDDNACTVDSCTAQGKCQNDELDDTEVPGAIQPEGDCHELRCVAGVETDTIDDTDLPIDGLECTRDVCTSGTPSHPPEPADTECAAGVCDGAGNCVGCTTGSDCGTDTFCRVFTCSGGGVCGVIDTTAGTPLPTGSQTAGDCKELQCNGSGGVMTVEKTTDIPPDDGNECTSEQCSGAVPIHPPLAANTFCTDGGSFCDGAGNCVECNMASQCAGAGVCEVNQCISKMCAVGNAAIHTACTAGGVACNGEGDCVQCTTDEHCADMGVEGACNLSTWSCEGCASKTCADYGATCGTFDDTCGSDIDCNDGSTNGNETDTDCGGDVTTCPNRCPDGLRCDTGSDCISGSCVDGTCGPPDGGVGPPPDAGTIVCSPDAGTSCSGPFCCGDKCPFLHNNGVGGGWYDCVALGTYNLTQAFAACESTGVGVGSCVTFTCSGRDLVCGNSATSCTCWAYGPPGDPTVGHVRSSFSCSTACPTATSPLWF